MEWKTNVKRKTREDAMERKVTGGGENKSTPLKPMEERLLHLIGKIHLGSNEVPDVLGLTEHSKSGHSRAEKKTAGCPFEAMINEAELIIVQESERETINETDMTEVVEEVHLLDAPETFQDDCLNDLAQAKPSSKGDVAEQRPFPSCDGGVYTSKRKPTVNRNKYTNDFIQSAAESYNDAQEMRYKAAVLNAEAIESLSDSISGFTAVYKEKVEVDRILAEAETIKANAMLMQAKTEQMKLQLMYFNNFASDLDD